MKTTLPAARGFAECCHARRRAPCQRAAAPRPAHGDQSAAHARRRAACQHADTSGLVRRVNAPPRPVPCGVSMCRHVRPRAACQCADTPGPARRVNAPTRPAPRGRKRPALVATLAEDQLPESPVSPGVAHSAGSSAPRGAGHGGRWIEPSPCGMRADTPGPARRVNAPTCPTPRGRKRPALVATLAEDQLPESPVSPGVAHSAGSSAPRGAGHGGRWIEPSPCGLRAGRRRARRPFA